ncbi:MAG: 30S ribosomal protein S6 [bacterium]|nr:30S ribosomal protein S6 [bacterium]
MDKEHNLYEVAYLVSPAYSEAEAQNFQQTLKNLVQSLGGLIDQEGEVFKRRLAYPIKKMREAYLGNFRFLLAGEKIAELENKLKTSKEVLRHLLVHTKRQPPRTIRSQVLKPSLIPQTDKPKKTQKTETEHLEPASDIAEIDKKLEEILGK